MTSVFDITITNGEIQAQGWRTNDPIVPSGGYGGHPTAARPKRSALTVWEGRNPFQLEIPMVLYRGLGQSCESDRIHLEQMATTPDRQRVKDQKGVKVEGGPSVTIPFPPGTKDSEWWIEDLRWGEEVRDPGVSGGQLTRKQVTVMLLERNDDKTIEAKLSAKKPTPLLFIYTVKKGDTMHSIAKSQLGDAKRWKEITKYNPKVRSDNDLWPKNQKKPKTKTLNLPTGAETLGPITSKPQPKSRG